MKVDRQESFRYMKMGGTVPDAVFMRRYAAIEEEVLAAIRPRYCAELVSVSSLEFPGESLFRTLDGCDHAFLFAATLGAGVDALLRKLSAASPADQLMADAIATSLIETYCDECECELSSQVGGERLRMRFSPGYGDLPLSVQGELLARLDASRRIGLSLTDSLMMVPSKSVSAIIGSSPETVG